MRRFAFAALAVVSWGLACESIDGLATGEEPDAGSDAGTTSSGDAAPVTDAAPEAADARPSTFCTKLGGEHALCDDFDFGPLGEPWSGETRLGGRLELVEAGVSEPNALAVIGEVNPTNVGLEKEILRPFSGIVCVFDFRVVQLGQPTTAVVGLSFVSPEVSRYTISLAVDADGAELETYSEGAAGGAAATKDPLPAPPIGAWRKVRLDVVVRPPAVGGGTPRAVVLVNGEQQVTRELTPPSNIQRARFKIGLVNGLAGAKNDWHVQFDNVVCDKR